MFTLEVINAMSDSQKQQVLEAINESLVAKWESKENRQKLLAILNYGHLFPEPDDDKTGKQLQYCLNRFESAKSHAEKIAAEQEYAAKLAKWESELVSIQDKLAAAGNDEALKAKAMAMEGNPIDNYLQLSKQRKDLLAELERIEAKKPTLETVGTRQPRANGALENSPANRWSETLEKTRFEDSFFAYSGEIGGEQVNHIIVPNKMLGELGLELVDEGKVEGKSHVLIGITEPIQTGKIIDSTRKEGNKTVYQFRREFELPATLTPNGDVRYITYSPRGSKNGPSGLEKAIVQAFDPSQAGHRRGWQGVAMADYAQADRLVKAKLASGLGGHNQTVKGQNIDRRG